MRVYLFNQQTLSVISRKEEMTDDTFLVTDAEAEKISDSLRYDGYVWVVDKYTVNCSGARPTNAHKWNDETKEWELDPALVQAELLKKRATAWEKVKELREQATKTGVAVEVADGVIKHFHTDDISRREYDGMGVMVVLNTFVPRQWKTIENDFVTMDLQLFKKLVVALASKVQHDYTNAEKLKAQIDKSNEPDKIDLSAGWSASYA